MNFDKVYNILWDYYDMGHNSIEVHEYANFLVLHGKCSSFTASNALDIFDETLRIG